MLTQEITPEIAAAYKAMYEKYKDSIESERKSGQELLEYIQDKFTLCELYDEAALGVVSENVLQNSVFAEHLSQGKGVKPVAFIVTRDDRSNYLYDMQEDLFEGMDIFVGIELQTGYFCVEGSCRLWDELNVFRGLDEYDLKNYVVTGMYIESLENLNLLKQVR